MGVRLLFALCCVGCQSKPTPQDGNPPSLGTGSPLEQAQAASQADPRSTLALFVSWDTAGHWLCSGCEPAFDSAYGVLVCWSPEEQCQTDAPGWDGGFVADRYRLEESAVVASTTDRIRFRVLYHLVGNIEGGAVHDIPPREWTWDVHLGLVDGAWKIVDPESQRPPVLSVAAARRLFPPVTRRRGN